MVKMVSRFYKIERMVDQWTHDGVQVVAEDDHRTIEEVDRDKMEKSKYLAQKLISP